MMFRERFIHGGVNFQMGQTYADGYGLRNVAKSLGDHFQTIFFLHKTKIYVIP